MTAALYSFPRQVRLLTPKEFRAVFEQPIRSQDEYFLVLARRNSLGIPRLGLAISKKNVRKAVDRNRIKRLTRESFRHRRCHLASIDIVVTARNAVLKADNAAIRHSLEMHWDSLVKRCDSYWCTSSSSTDSC